MTIENFGWFDVVPMSININENKAVQGDTEDGDDGFKRQEHNLCIW